jgi:hypothetical protein
VAAAVPQAIVSVTVVIVLTVVRSVTAIRNEFIYTLMVHASVGSTNVVVDTVAVCVAATGDPIVLAHAIKAAVVVSTSLAIVTDRVLNVFPNVGVSSTWGPLITISEGCG